mmetsp:Transcript_18305/g.51342  ORF Transcript_18305/g.51342 Transcript_18305/m.51342 type:complete len:248 (-) Transcript_18305:2369-3112(-)
MPGETWLLLSAVDREGLPAARLAIGKDAHVEAVHRALYQVLGILKHVCLAAAWVKHLVKVVLAVLLLIAPCVGDGELIRNLEAEGLTFILLKVKDGSYAAVHADLALQILHHVEGTLARHLLLAVQLLQLIQPLGLILNDAGLLLVLALNVCTQLAQLLQLSSIKLVVFGGLLELVVQGVDAGQLLQDLADLVILGLELAAHVALGVVELDAQLRGFLVFGALQALHLLLHQLLLLCELAHALLQVR